MTGHARHLVLNAYLRNSGYHEAAWRVGGGDPAAVLDPRYYVGLARTAERGVLDAIFLPDSPGIAEFRAEYLPNAGFDPIDLLAYVAAGTERVGLIATVSTTYGHPWDVARRLATLDVVSGGRAGWNIVTTVEPAAAANFGGAALPDHAARYERAAEFVEVALKLWDAWEPGAAVLSRRSGRWADPGRIHPPRHHGEHFDVASFLPFPRSPQGRPLLALAGASAPARQLAARFADAVFTPAADPDECAGCGRSSTAGRPSSGARPGGAPPPRALVHARASPKPARDLHEALEAAASSEFRWRNLANLAGLDPSGIDPDGPFPRRSSPRRRGRASARRSPRLAGAHPGTFRSVAERLSALPGGLDFTGTPDGLADLIACWWERGACDGFTLMPNVLPEQLELFVDEVVPRLRARGLARHRYADGSLRDRLGDG